MLYYLERGYVGRGLSGEENRESESEKKGGRTKGEEEEEDSSNVVKELSVRMKRRLGRAPFATEISRELERL
jgi:hypothetical protein